jgi:hypothetical protein
VRDGVALRRNPLGDGLGVARPSFCRFGEGRLHRRQRTRKAPAGEDASLAPVQLLARRCELALGRLQAVN